MNITVYLGAREGNSSILTEKAVELGKWIATHGHHLIYGGSECGLMGKLANAVLENGGEVTGVEPRFFLEKGYEHPSITTLIETETMAERKRKMIELGDVFIAFPGGTGTLDEISEVMSLMALNQLDGACILYNINGYYDHLKALLSVMIENGLSSQKRQRCICFVDTFEEIDVILNDIL